MQDIDIGGKVYKFRKFRGMSSRTLSNLANISASMLSQIEKSQATPSINTLKAIAEALNIPLYNFFLHEVDITSTPVVKQEDRQIIHYPETGVVYEMLTSNSRTEFCLMHLPPHMASSDKLFTHKGEEVAYVLTGRATVLIENTEYLLEEGDSITIQPNTRHCWQNNSNEETIYIFAIAPQAF